jgi:hypothetical protein
MKQIEEIKVLELKHSANKIKEGFYMGRFSKFLGKVSIEVDGEKLELSITVGDVQKLVDMSKTKENEIVNGVNVITDIICNSMDEPREEVEAYVLKNYADLSQEIIIALGWTTREKLEQEISSSKKE